jgi:ribonucleoside-triphosphate reductase (thioredoxin)
MLPTSYQQYIHASRYARWLPEEGRRETWEETVDRYINFWLNRGQINEEEARELENAIYNLEVMPSMRALMTAGPALERDNVAGFNCSYVAVNNQRSFDEIMYVLLCGTGVGFSVEKKYVSQLPIVADEFHESDTVIVVPDSKIGWATSFRELISLLYNGKIPKWDLSRIRPKGAPLKTFGGRASGPEPLDSLFNFAVGLFTNAKGRRLNSLDCHDLVCKVAEIVVVGGVRRSALISLSDLDDDQMRVAKTGAWWESDVHRALANNSAVYNEKPNVGRFMKEWEALYESKSGERGIFNRESAQRFVPDRRRELGYTDWGTNPCSEIVLRDKQFCNLSEVVVRSMDTLEDLKRKVRLASTLGTLQSTLTDFRYLSAQWKRNTEEERLLGVSLTGIMDHPVLSGEGVAEEIDYMDRSITEVPTKWGLLQSWLRELKEVAIETNKQWADKLGVNVSTAITCVKPSGTVSQLVDCASGIHPRYARHYIRTVRSDQKDPISQFLIDQGVPCEPDVTKPHDTYVFSFPMRAPDSAVLRDDMTAIDQLNLWKIYQEYWCEHKPSITVYVREGEWMDVGAWVYNNFNAVSGISFLPHTDHVYKQAPYQEITEEEYEKSEKVILDWEKFFNGDYEKSDMTIGSQELACTGGSCEI